MMGANIGINVNIIIIADSISADCFPLEISLTIARDIESPTEAPKPWINLANKINSMELAIDVTIPDITKNHQTKK